MKESTIESTVAEEAAITVAEEAAITAAFETGLKRSKVQEPITGHIVHHKNFVISNRVSESLDAAKEEELGPNNPAGTVDVHRPESFVEIYNRHNEARTQMFADAPKSEIITIFDFLQPDQDEAPLNTGWGQFRARMKLITSRKLGEWKKLTEWQGQEEFANFLEDHLEDVADPSGQSLLEMATDLEATSSGAFHGKVNLSNGSVNLSYQDETQTTVEVPSKLTLGIPLFEHGDKYRLGVRLRFRVAGGNVRFKIIFTNLDDALESEFERIVQDIEEKAKTTVIRGSLNLPW